MCIARALAVDPEVLLLDEPCSALDPVSTGKIEELIDEIKQRYTIVIVTHNMQQAARVSDYTAFMYLGELVEFGETKDMFERPKQSQNGRLHHRALRVIPAPAQFIGKSQGMIEHTVKAYDQELNELARLVTEMGALAERQIRNSIDALVNRDEHLASQVIAADEEVDELQQQIETMTIHLISKRQPMAIDLRDIVARCACLSIWNA